MEVSRYDSFREMRQLGAFVFRLNDNGQGPDLVRQVFLERGWVEFEDDQEDNDWNLFWRTSRFRTGDYDLLMPWQRVNHFPKSMSITKKDCLARNLKRMKGIYGNGVYNFSPVAFNLPNDYTKFVSEYTRLRQLEDPKMVLWICKPADLSRGRGIFLFRELANLQYDCSAVVQRYIANPLLIGGYKFDLRIYVLVPCFQPLAIYIYQEGLVRFSTEKFDLESLNNIFSHLTNTSINKHSPQYTTDKERVGPGCKWTLTQLRHYFHQNNIDDRMLFARITNIVILTLIMQAPQVPKVNNCFELYGFDIIIDENLKPWLLEVNFSPALGMDCQADSIVKKPLIHDLLDVMRFKESDKERGVSLAINCQSPTRNKCNNSVYARRQSLVSRQRTASFNNLNKANLTKFGGSTISLSSQNKTSYCYEFEGEDSDDDPVLTNIRPMAGGGLPIIKDRGDIKQTSDSSGFSSASSHGSNQGQETKKQDRGSARLKSPATVGRKQSKESLGATPRSQKSVEDNKTGTTKNTKVKQESKLSLNSDSAMSSESDRCPSAANANTSTVKQKPPTRRKNSEQGAPSGSQTARSCRPKPILLFSVKPSASSTGVSSDWSTGPSKQFGIKSCVSMENLSSSGFVQRSYSNNRPDAITPLQARNLKRSSFSIADRQIFDHPPGSPYHRVGNRRHIAKSSLSATKSPPKSGPPLQVGNYFLVFPVNDGMLKASKPVLDVRLAIQESQKVLKKSLLEIRTGSPAKLRPALQPADVTDQLWAPLRFPEAEV